MNDKPSPYDLEAVHQVTRGHSPASLREASMRGHAAGVKEGRAEVLRRVANYMRELELLAHYQEPAIAQYTQGHRDGLKAALHNCETAFSDAQVLRRAEAARQEGEK